LIINCSTGIVGFYCLADIGFASVLRIISR
jgi:hypothetical protein